MNDSRNTILKKRLARTYRSRITIKKRTVEIVNGRQVQKVEDYYNCACNPRELYSKELYQAINVKLENTALFEVRYCREVEKMRYNSKDFIVEFENHTFNIYQVDFLSNDNHVVLLRCNMVN